MSEEEDEKQPEYLCPICLRKLWYTVGFDPLERFKALHKACDKIQNKHFAPQKQWYSDMVTELEKKYKNSCFKVDKPYKKRYPKKDPKKSA